MLYCEMHEGILQRIAGLRWFACLPAAAGIAVVPLAEQRSFAQLRLYWSRDVIHANVITTRSCAVMLGVSRACRGLQ